MAVLYFDTSALVRRYDPREPGAAQVRALCRRGSGHDQMIARITLVEVAATLTVDFRFCTADRAQAEAAEREGLAVELIE